MIWALLLFALKYKAANSRPGSYLQIFVGLYWTGLETKRQIAKKMRLKRKKERKTEKNCKEGRGKKPNI